MPKISKTLAKPSEQFTFVDDQKLRLSLIAKADEWNDFARTMIYNTYNDPTLLGIYKAMRNSGVFDKGNVRREVIRFPNGYVYEFCKATFAPMYGNDWPINPKVWKHELIRPWLLINLK